MNGLLKFRLSNQDTTAEPPITGRIMDILQDTSGKTSLIVLDVFQVAAVRHEMFGMPILKRRLNEKQILVILAMVSGECILKDFLLPNSLNALNCEGHSFQV